MTVDAREGATPSYAEALFGLRPSRIAIVFPADTPHWMFFARAALWEANQIWGGAGFVLVPHHGGDVSDTLLRAVAAYDPDYVVGHRVTWKELLAGYPEAMPQLVDSDGQPVPEEKRAEFLAPVEQEHATDLITEAAREMVAKACEVYRRHAPSLDFAPASDAAFGRQLPRWDRSWQNASESAAFLNDDGLTRVEALGSFDDACLAAPSSLSGAWGAMAAAIVGTVRRPSLGETGDEPSSDQARELCVWFYRRLASSRVDLGPKPPLLLAHHHAGLKLGWDTATLPTAWSRTTSGLVTVREQPPSSRQATFVVGDAADDFALAIIIDRVWGNALWVHSDWSPETPGDVGLAARQGLQLLALRRAHRATITSASGSAGDVTPVASFFSLAAPFTGPETWEHTKQGDTTREPSEQQRSSAGEGIEAASNQPSTVTARSTESEIEIPASFDAPGKMMLALAEDYSIRIALPVLSDDDATVLAAATPILRPSDSALASNPSLAWHVDIHLSGTNMPRGRGLDGHALAATVDEQYETWIRVGNRGVSFDSRKWDFVPTGANLGQRLARPQIQFLSLLAWCRSMAAQAGYDIGWSDAGRRARLLERMWGGRRELITDFATDLTQLTELFNRTGKTTPAVYPNKEGVFVRGVGGFLNFDGLRGVLAPADPPAEPADEANGKSEGTETEADVDLEQSRLNLIARTRIDSYVKRGIIRRGLLLVCGTCDQVNFIPVGELGQRNDCTRCGALTDLTLDAWRLPTDEPTWFYDLHQVVRALVRDHGHAPLWLAHHLAANARNYSDCAELNLLEVGKRTSVAELDLVAHVDGKLITAEVKTNNSIASKADRTDSAWKRIIWAAVLRADEIILATSQREWQPASIAAMKHALSAAVATSVFAPNHAPQLRLITGLGSADCRDTYQRY